MMTPAKNATTLECYQCANCGWASLVQKAGCPQCHSKDIRAVRAEGRGEVIDFTSVHYPPDAYKSFAPYTSIFVKLTNGCTLFGVIEGLTGDIPAGSPVTVVKQDETTKGWFFKLG